MALFRSVINLSALNGHNGFQINGKAGGGDSVASYVMFGWAPAADGTWRTARGRTWLTNATGMADRLAAAIVMA